MTVRSYIEVDSGLETEMLDDEEIIAAIQDVPSDDDAEGDVSPLISNKIALENIQILCKYLEQNKDIEVNNQCVSGLRDLERKIGRKQINSLKQTNIDVVIRRI